MTLLLKLVLVPGLIALVTLAGRRFGPRLGGWLNALPLVAGPVLFFLALEQGDAFVARAAQATLAGLAAVAAFSVIYAWTAVVRACVGWRAGRLDGLRDSDRRAQAVAWTAARGLALSAGRLRHRALHAPPAFLDAPIPAPAPAWDRPCAMGGGRAWCWGVTARRLARPAALRRDHPVPVATTILLAFTHAQQGAPAAVGFLRAFLPAMWSFALFCFVLAVGVVGLGRDLAFPLALAVHLAVQGVVWLGLDALASRGSARRGPRAARRSA